MKNICLCVIISFFTITVHSTSEEFIVPKKPIPIVTLSRSKLKEGLGDVAKQLFAETISLVKKIGGDLQKVAAQKQPNQAKVLVPVTMLQAFGQLHQHVAYVQKVCGNVAENLLDDEPRLAKASKKSLTQALETMKNMVICVRQLHQQDAITPQEQVKKIAEMVDQMKSDACLRQEEI
jgi:hypothetical protein